MPERFAATWNGLEELADELARYLGFRCRDESDVDDVVQETLLRAARFRSKLVHPEALRAWTFRIAGNVLADRLRREQRLGRPLSSVELLEAQPAPESAEPEPATDVRCGEWTVDREVALDLLSGELKRLRSDDRDLLKSYYGSSGSCREVGAAHDLPAEVVKVRLFRARRRLLRALRRRLALTHCARRRPEVGARS